MGNGGGDARQGPQRVSQGVADSELRQAGIWGLAHEDKPQGPRGREDA